MKKQIVYVNLMPRLFASAIDLIILTIICTPIMTLISATIYSFLFKDFLIQKGIAIYTKEVFAVFQSSGFIEYVFSANLTQTYLTAALILNLINAVFIALYFLAFWNYTSTTPGKMLMHIKIVDAESFAKPTKWQFIKRLFGYVTAIIGLWSALVSTKKQAMHDRISGTVVIKA